MTTDPATDAATTDGPPDRAVTAQRLDRAAGLAVYLLAAAPWIWWYLVDRPAAVWQVDLEVYRDGAMSLLQGRPAYDWLTSGPQWLPFTYPPLPALLGLPLAMVPLRAAGWLWTALQLWLDLWATGVAFAPLLRRLPRHRHLAQGVLAGALLATLPVSDGLRFGQVNAVIVALCLADFALPRHPLRPRGALVALATSIKLTPGVFMLHYIVRRDVRRTLTTIGAAAALTVLSLLIVPAAGVRYWFEALLDPERLGPNAGAANQSLRAVLLRTALPEHPWLTVVWGALAVAVLVLGLRAASRLELMGDPVGVVAACGLVAFLVSPVSWAHHLHWLIVVLGATIGDGRRRSRVLWALAGLVVMWCRLPWWGATILGTHHDAWVVLGGVLECAYTGWALLMLVMLARWSRADLRARDAESGPDDGDAVDPADDAVRTADPAGLRAADPAGS